AEAEAKRKVAEAFERYGQAAVLDMVVKMLPDYAKQVASPLGNIDQITVVDTGVNNSESGANKVTSYATDLMSTMQESLKASAGIEIKEMLDKRSGKNNRTDREMPACKPNVTDTDEQTVTTENEEK